MENTLTNEERVELITRNLAEVVGKDEILKLLNEKGKINIYWGTATTGKPHLGYFVPLFKIADFLKAGCEVTILIADLHGFLDHLKSTWELLQYRTEFYKLIITEMLKTINAPLEKLKFVQGTDYQLSKEYTLDVYKLSTLSTTEHTSKAGAEVVKQTKNPLMSSLLYPILQALDEEYLGVDAQFGGVDQRKIFMFARESLPKIGYKKRIHLMNPLIPGLTKSGKMSSSEPQSKIDFDDPDDLIRSKFKNAFSVDGVAEGNGLLSISKYILFRLFEDQKRNFVVKRPEKYGGDIEFDSYEKLEATFVNNELASEDLKKAIAEEIILLTRPIREILKKNKNLLNKAYPPEKKKKQPPQPKKNTVSPPTIESLDIRVGKILEVEKHPNADKLYVEKIDVGEEAPRTILSGLVEHIPIDELRDRLVLVLCNLPDKEMKGIKSQGMVLASSTNKEGEPRKVVLVDPPKGAKPGEKLKFDVEGQVEPKISSKRLEKVMKKCKVNSEGVAVYIDDEDKEHPFTTSDGVCTSPLKDSDIS